MAEYDKTNTFALFDNDDKQSEKHADKTGYVNINGKEYWLNGWNRANGVIGGSVKPKEPRREVTDTQSGYEKAKAVAQSLKTPQDTISLDDIPF
jgi:hypothetical protein